MTFDELPKVKFADAPVGARIVFGATLLVKIDPIHDEDAKQFYGKPDFAWNTKHGPLHGSGGSCGEGVMHVKDEEPVAIIRREDFQYADQWFATAESFDAAAWINSRDN